MESSVYLVRSTHNDFNSHPAKRDNWKSALKNFFSPARIKASQRRKSMGIILILIEVLSSPRTPKSNGLAEIEEDEWNRHE